MARIKFDFKKIIWLLAIMIILAVGFNLLTNTVVDDSGAKVIEIVDDVGQATFDLTKIGLAILLGAAALIIFLNFVQQGKITRNDWFYVIILGVLFYFIWNGVGDIPGVSDFFALDSWESITASVMSVFR